MHLFSFLVSLLSLFLLQLPTLSSAEKLDDLDILNVIAGGFSQINFTSVLASLAGGDRGPATAALQGLGLLGARVLFVDSYQGLEATLRNISAVAEATNNPNVDTLAKQGLRALATGAVSINNIVDDILTGTTVSHDDQATASTALNITRLALQAMPAAVQYASNDLNTLFATAGTELLSAINEGDVVLGDDTSTPPPSSSSSTTNNSTPPPPPPPINNDVNTNPNPPNNNLIAADSTSSIPADVTDTLNKVKSYGPIVITVLILNVVLLLVCAVLAISFLLRKKTVFTRAKRVKPTYETVNLTDDDSKEYKNYQDGP